MILNMFQHTINPLLYQIHRVNLNYLLNNFIMKIYNSI